MINKQDPPHWGWNQMPEERWYVRQGKTSTHSIKQMDLKLEKLLTAGVAVVVGTSFIAINQAIANTSCRTIGNQTYCTNQSGQSTRVQRVGQQTYTNSGGRMTTCRTIGSQTICN